MDFRIMSDDDLILFLISNGTRLHSKLMKRFVSIRASIYGRGARPNIDKIREFNQKFPVVIRRLADSNKIQCAELKSESGHVYRREWSVINIEKVRPEGDGWVPCVTLPETPPDM